MGGFFAKSFNVVIKIEFSVYSKTKFFFAIFKDFSIKRKFSLFRFATQAHVMTFTRN